MIRERTGRHLLVGVVMSVLIHASVVLWGPPLSLRLPAPDLSTDLEVQLREWPAAPSPPAAESPAVVEPPPPPQPAAPPNTVVLQDAVQTSLLPLRPEPAEIRLPERPPPMPAPDPARLAQALMDSLRAASPPPAAVMPSLPEPERRLAERRELPPLPNFERTARREAVPSRPPTMTLPATAPNLRIQGPAAERQVIFQPPPPSVTVEGETEIELRFWILPNGTVSRVVPLKKSDPRLEALAINYLRHWRFNPLPPEAGQDEQWGIIPFKFRIR
jgi:TonB family protein